MSSPSDREYLLTLESVREQAQHVYDAAVNGHLNNFIYDATKLDAAADYVVSLILRDWKPEMFSQIPPHGRWQHFNAGGVPRLDPLIEQWKTHGIDEVEISRRVVDIIVVSVLLDAGAGDHWTFTDRDGVKIGRSEGLAVASLSAFNSNIFGESCVDARLLAELDSEKLANAMQNYMLKNGSTGDALDFKVLWSLLQDLLIPTWPEGRTTVAGAAIGDAWPLKVLADQKQVLHIQPFHKLTQWLAYSLTSAIQRLLSKDWVNMDILTGLPEYRNGGLFVDMQVLALKPEVLEAGLKQGGKTLPEYNADGDVIVEWRAMTVILLDIVAKMVNEKIAQRCGPGVSLLSLAQILEAGTWKAGRELAKQHRASLNACSPILMSSDGTLF
ncbi:DUF1688-domain-containing protein, partial [Aureobasidium melanogenum]